MALCWYFSKTDIQSCTPSRKDGIDITTETRYRKEGVKLIVNASTNMGLRYDTQATSVVYFHRFFMLQSFKQFNRWVVAMSCLLLAGKVEETPKKSKDVLKQAKSLLSDHQFAKFGSDPREELFTHERILLQTMKFDLQVEHPYSYILKFGKQLKGDKMKLQKIVQMAWTFVNDSLGTTLCLQWESPAIAIAFLFLAARLSKYDLQAQAVCKTKSWWRQFIDTIDVHDLEDICSHVLDLYGEKDTVQGQQSSNAARGSDTPGGISQHSDNSQYPNTSYSSHQPITQPTILQSIMQAQQSASHVQKPFMPGQQPVMHVQQPGIRMHQPIMQAQQATIPMQQPGIPVHQSIQSQQPPVIHGHQSNLQLQQQTQQQLSNIPLSQRITLLPTPMVGSPSSNPVQQQQQQQMIPVPSLPGNNIALSNQLPSQYVTHNHQ
ncbi:cyclin-K-like isoform X1 [Dysidea avara]|uniref:cyclin-K-like isoform X1 n=1 Tax=Dysidea avara TaxID=196820 RepID=UPI0033179775